MTYIMLGAGFWERGVRTAATRVAYEEGLEANLCGPMRDQGEGGTVRLPSSQGNNRRSSSVICLISASTELAPQQLSWSEDWSWDLTVITLKDFLGRTARAAHAC
jgi:hypothetical protein